MIQKEPVESLDEVTGKIVPYAVDMSNTLNPSRQIGKDIVEQMIDLAYKADKLVPRRLKDGEGLEKRKAEIEAGIRRLGLEIPGSFK